MAKDNNLNDFLTDLASAIRTKKEYPSTQKINPQNFSNEITSISGGKKYASGTFTNVDISKMLTGGYYPISELGLDFTPKYLIVLAKYTYRVSSNYFGVYIYSFKDLNYNKGLHCYKRNMQTLSIPTTPFETVDKSFNIQEGYFRLVWDYATSYTNFNFNSIEWEAYE